MRQMAWLFVEQTYHPVSCVHLPTAFAAQADVAVGALSSVLQGLHKLDETHSIQYNVYISSAGVTSQGKA
jgi:hypothetical protein